MPFSSNIIIDCAQTLHPKLSSLNPRELRQHQRLTKDAQRQGACCTNGKNVGVDGSMGAAGSGRDYVSLLRLLPATTTAATVAAATTVAVTTTTTA